ncbi:MAG: rhodanese-like domain-containing protein [Burkholderiaceae bacterium]|nr:rhodanese-like domain-containing protein [Burkholderiaceae bacterium]
MRRVLFGVLLLAVAGAGAARDFAYVGARTDAYEAIVDTRAAARCAERSLEGARCLPAEDLLGPQRRLPNARDLLWLLGTAGLSGRERVLVIGDDPTARDFVAGVLYVAGQRQVHVLTEPVPRVLAGGAPAAPGMPRTFARQTVFVAPMRDDALVLREELRALLSAAEPPVLLDGRSAAEFWGERARTVRTGRLPGAVHLPAEDLRATRPDAERAPLLPRLAAGRAAVAYAHDAFEGFAYFTRLAAGFALPVRLYAEGWAQWAADGTLPADAVGYPELAVPAAPPSPSRADDGRLLWAAGGATAGALLAAAAFALGSMRRRSVG